VDNCDHFSFSIVFWSWLIATYVVIRNQKGDKISTMVLFSRPCNPSVRTVCSMTMLVLLGHDRNLDLSSRMMIMKMRKVKVTKIRTVLANTGYCKLVVNKHKVVETPGWSNSANIYVHRPKREESCSPFGRWRDTLEQV